MLRPVAVLKHTSNPTVRAIEQYVADNTCSIDSGPAQLLRYYRTYHLHLLTTRHILHFVDIPTGEGLQQTNQSTGLRGIMEQSWYEYCILDSTRWNLCWRGLLFVPVPGLCNPDVSRGTQTGNTDVDSVQVSGR